MDHNHKIIIAIQALEYIAARKCDCAKVAKEPPPCSHERAKDALAKILKR